MSYNLTFMETSTNLLTVTQAVNTNSGGLFGALFIFMLWIGAYVLFSREGDNITAFLVSSFLTSVAGILMLLVGDYLGMVLLTWKVLVLPMISLLVGVVFLVAVSR